MQDLIDAMNEITKDVRADYHVTLGKLLESLKNADPTLSVVYRRSDNEHLESFREVGSYRGHYSDLALEPGSSMTVKQLRDELESILDTELTGYKGGEFLMDARTPLWVSAHGECSQLAVMDTEVVGKHFFLRTKYTGD